MRDLHAAFKNANWASRLKVVFWGIFNYFPMVGFVYFPRPKNKPFSAKLFLVLGCFATTAWNVGVHNREHLCQELSTWAHGVNIWDVFHQGRWHHEMWTVSICIARQSSRQHCRTDVSFRISYHNSGWYMPISRAALPTFLLFIICVSCAQLIICLDNVILSFRTQY